MYEFIMARQRACAASTHIAHRIYSIETEYDMQNVPRTFSTSGREDSITSCDSKIYAVYKIRCVCLFYSQNEHTQTGTPGECEIEDECVREMFRNRSHLKNAERI